LPGQERSAPALRRDDHHRQRADAAVDGAQEIPPPAGRAADLERGDLRGGQQPRRHRRRDLFPQRRRLADADPQGPAAAARAPLHADPDVASPPPQGRAPGSPAAAALLVPASSLAAAQESYPGKPIRLIAPEVPGSATDILARIIAAKLADGFGQPVTVSN